MKPSIFKRSTLAEAETKLSQQDPILGSLIAKQQLKLRPQKIDYFESLSSSIVGQQVSVAAATAIFNRFKDATNLNPEKLLSLNDDEMRAIGLSKQKTGYLRDLAQHFKNDPAVYNHLEEQEDNQVIAELTAVKGIGVWTAQMFLMSTLGRLDVFAPDDVGLQRAIKLLYNYESVPPKKELEEIALKWSPYRTVASRHLWQSLDNNPA